MDEKAEYLKQGAIKTLDVRKCNKWGESDKKRPWALSFKGPQALRKTHSGQNTSGFLNNLLMTITAFLIFPTFFVTIPYILGAWIAF